MHPKDFKDFWKLTNTELADLIGGYSVDGVQHWLRSNALGKVPESVLNHLANLHSIFLFWEAQKDLLPPSQSAIFEIAYARRLKIRAKNITES